MKGSGSGVTRLARGAAAAGLGFAALVLPAGCDRPVNQAGLPGELPPAAVQVATVERARIPVMVDAIGSVRAVQRAQIAARISGAIESLPVALGQPVRTGDVLVRLAAAELIARRAQAEAQLASARRDLERERGLLAQGASAAETVRSLEDRVMVAEAVAREAAVLLEYTTIRAPFDGTVTQRRADAGDLASPGQALLEIEGVGGFEIDADFPESVATELRPGAGVQVLLPDGERFTAKLSELSLAADPRARTVAAKLVVPAGARVRSGQFVRLEIPGPAVDALLAPAGAVSWFGQMERAFVADAENRARLRLVRTGARQGDRVQILAGLDAGERVVVAPPATLRDGQPLEIRP